MRVGHRVVQGVGGEVNPGRLTHAELLPHLRERRDRAVDLLVRVRRRHLDADAGLALRHHRVAEADHVDAAASAARRPSSSPAPRRRASPAGSASARA